MLSHEEVINTYIVGICSSLRFHYISSGYIGAADQNIKQILNFVEFNTHWHLPSEKTSFQLANVNAYWTQQNLIFVLLLSAITLWHASYTWNTQQQLGPMSNIIVNKSHHFRWQHQFNTYINFCILISIIDN